MYLPVSYFVFHLFFWQKSVNLVVAHKGFFCITCKRSLKKLVAIQKIMNFQLDRAIELVDW